MSRNYPHIPFERYADDAICHCKSADRRGRYGTRCRIASRPASWRCTLRRRRSSTARMRTAVATFRTSRSTFSGLRSERGKRWEGTSALCVLPARRQSESVDVHQPNRSALGASSSQRQVPAGPGRDVQPVHSRLDQLLQPLLQDAVASDLKRIDLYVIRWARRKFKRLRRKTKGARDWLDRIRRANPTLFAHWTFMSWQRPNIGSRVNLRGSCTVLGAPGGEIPSGDSTIASVRFDCQHVRS